MKRIIILTGLFLSLSVLTAHEYWVAPVQYRVNPGESFVMNCYVGEDFKPEIWQRRRERTDQVSVFHRQSKRDITPLFTAVDSVDILLALREKGNHLLALHSKPSYIELKADEFNQYLEEDGIEDVLAYRKSAGLTTQPSRELYERCAKSLLQVGVQQDYSYSQITSMPLEILPMAHPLQVTDSLPVQVLFKGKPLRNYRIRSWCKANGRLLQKENHRTNEQGIVSIPLRHTGEWMISLVKMEVLSNHPSADYHSYWGSYTFYRE